MDLISPDAPISSVLLEDQKNGTRMCLDVIPARWTARVAMDDAVLTLAAMLLGSQPMWHTSDPEYYVEKGYDGDDVTIAPGGFVYHTGASLSATERTPRIVLDGQGLVHLPDGLSYGWQDFAAINEHPYDHHGATQRQVVLSKAQGRHRQAQGQETPESTLAAAVMAFVLGAMESFVESPSSVRPGHTSREFLQNTFSALAGRALRHLACVPRSGTDAVTWLAGEAKTPTQMALFAWALRPDRGWAPTRFVLGRFHAEAVDACVDSCALEAGRRAGRLFFGRGYDHSLLLPSSHEYLLTAHQKIGRRSAQRDVEDAALSAYTTDPTRLKPQAGKRAAAMGAATLGGINATAHQQAA